MNKSNGKVPQKVKTLARITLLLLLSLFLSLVKLWLVAGQSFYAIYVLDDDTLFLNNANFLLKGDWLGPYTHWTLAKGPFYPLWIAASLASDIPLFLTHHVLYIAACSLFVLSIRPVVQKPIMLFILFTVLLFNPMSYADPVGTRVLREGIYPALTVMVFSGAIGLMIRCHRSLRNLLLWSIGLGLTFSAFWLTREEGIWMILPVLTILCLAAVRIYGAKPVARIRRLILCILPFLILSAAILTVAAINKSYYGIFSTNEFKAPYFLDAYGALTRVKHANWNPKIPVPKEARERIYDAVPSFAELKGYLDGPLGKGWIKDSCLNLSICDDIAGGWFAWAFRYAVADAGYYRSGESTRAYYERLASEINAACEEKRFDCGPARSTLASPWHAEYARPLFTTIVDSAVYLAAFKGANASSGESPKLSQMADLRITVLDGIGGGYRFLMPLLVIPALMAYILRTIHVLRKRELTDLYVASSAIITAIVVRLFIISLIEISSFPAVNTIYLSPAHPLLLVFVIFGLIDGEKMLFPPK